MAATPEVYTQAVMLMGAAVVAAPIFKRIGLGPVLGYVAAAGAGTPKHPDRRLPLHARLAAPDARHRDQNHRGRVRPCLSRWTTVRLRTPGRPRHAWPRR